MSTVTVFNEYVTQQDQDEAMDIYPDGIHAVLAEAFEAAGHDVQVALHSDDEHGLTEDVVAATDVLVYWSHSRNDEFDDDVVDRLHEAVLGGLNTSTPLTVSSPRFSPPWVSSLSSR